MKKILLAVLVLVLFYSTAVAIEIVRQKNAATYIFVPLIDADGDIVTSATGLDSEIDTWNDGAAPDGFTDCTPGEASEIGVSGWYYLSLSQSEMNADYIAIRIQTTSAGAKTQHILIRTIVGDPLNLATTTSGTELTVAAADGRAAVNVEEWDGTDVPSPNVGGYPEVDLVYYEGATDVDGEIQSEAADALTAYDPPTRTEATTDKSAIITEVDANETKIDAVDNFVDTEIAAIKGKTDSLNFQGVAAGVALAVDATRISGDATAANNAELFFDGTGYAGTNNVIPTVTTVSNEVTADAVKISGDATAANNAELFFDGTGYAGTNNVIPTVTTVTNEVSADAVKISGDATAANNAELFFDGTGYAGTNNVIPSVTTTTNLTTNNDKTGYALTAAERKAIADSVHFADTTQYSETDTTMGQMIITSATAAAGGDYSDELDSLLAAAYDRTNDSNFVRIISQYVLAIIDSIQAHAPHGDNWATAGAGDTSEIKKLIQNNWDSDTDAFLSAELSAGGARTMTITVKDTIDSLAIAGFEVDVYDSSSGQYMGGGETNTNGVYTQSLDDETYTIHLKKVPYNLATPRYFIVAADIGSTFYASEFDAGDPASASMCRIYINDIRDLGAIELEDYELKAYIPEKYHPVTVGDAIRVPRITLATSDASGYVYLDVYRSTGLTAGDGTSTVLYDLELLDDDAEQVVRRRNVEIPDQANWEIDWTAD